MGQGYVELHIALERALAFPAGEDLASPDRGFLEDFQTIAKAAVEIAVEVQMAVLAAVDMGNIHADVADLGVEQQALAGLDAHAAVFDQHIAVHLLHLRPAWLEVECGVVNLEEQADAASLRGGAVVQRTLVLEVALIDVALDDGAAQPFVEGRAQHFGQVLGGIAAIAFGQADPQVHVAFGAFVEQQANEEIASDLALLAQHLEVGGDEGETMLVERPGQARIGLLVLPGFGEDRVQVQHECVSIQPQLAMPEVAADAAADIASCRCAMIGIETDPLQVGGELQPLVALGVWPCFQPNVAQRPGDVQPIDHGHELVRQGCQGIDQRGQRGEVKAVGLHLPGFVGRVVAQALVHLQVRFPAALADARRE